MVKDAFDAEKARAEERVRFREATTVLFDTGAVEVFEEAAGIIPGAQCQIVDDPNTNFRPEVRLLGRNDVGSLTIGNEEILLSERRTLHASVDPDSQSDINFSVVENKEVVSDKEKDSLSSGLVWNKTLRVGDGRLRSTIREALGYIQELSDDTKIRLDRLLSEPRPTPKS